MTTLDFVCLLVSIPRRGHDDEVLDVCFDFTGQYVATASADGKMSHLKLLRAQEEPAEPAT